jgi:hypothetical protein
MVALACIVDETDPVLDPVDHAAGDLERRLEYLGQALDHAHGKHP